MIHTITTEWKHDMVFTSDNPSGLTVDIDSSEEFGGTQSGLRPKALMLSSLSGCSGLDVVSLLNKMRVTVDNFKIIVSAELTEDHPKIYKKVKVDYHFYGQDLKKEKIKKAVDLSIEKYCGVYEMFRHFAEMESEIHYHSQS